MWCKAVGKPREAKPEEVIFYDANFPAKLRKIPCSEGISAGIEPAAAANRRVVAEGGQQRGNIARQQFGLFNRNAKST